MPGLTASSPWLTSLGTNRLPNWSPMSKMDRRARGAAPLARSGTVLLTGPPPGPGAAASRAPTALPHVCVPWKSSSPYVAPV